MLSKQQYLKKKFIKKIITLILIFFATISLGVFIGKNFFINTKIPKNKNLEKIYFQLPYIYDPKAVIKAKYLNLSDYPSYQLVKCLVNKNCVSTNILITAYIYEKANEDFCNDLKNNITIDNKTFYIENLEDVKKVCKVFYLMKEHKLEKKDCIDPVVSTICATYFEYKKTDFVKSNLEMYKLLNKDFKELKVTTGYCLNLEKPVSYYCLKEFKLGCTGLESKEYVKKCYDLLVIPDKQYSNLLKEVNNYLENKEWDKIIKLINIYSNNSKYLHSIARLGALNGSICSSFSNYSSKEERYCLKRYFNQRLLCDYSPDKRQCYFFDVILNDKECNELRDPILITDCKLFKKYYGKVNCSFFYKVGSDEYLGYLCAIKSGNCEGNNYYDKMYKLICEYWTNTKNN